MVTYVRLVRHRFEAINEFIRKVCLLNERKEVNHDLLKIMRNVSSTLPVTSKSDDRKMNLYNKLIETRAAYQLLYGVSEDINVLFRWTLPINIANDFQKGLTNTYFFITMVLKWDSETSNRLQLPRPLLWAMYNIAHIMILSSACQHACEEARLTPALLHEIDFSLSDQQLAGLVGFHPNKHVMTKMMKNSILQIQLFSTQLMRQKVNFTAFGLLNVDYTLIFTVSN